MLWFLVCALARDPHLEAHLKELDSMIGLASVKQAVRDIVDLVELDMARKEAGRAPIGSTALHMRFNGNPGTGKTVVARQVGRILTALGAITPGAMGGGAEDAHQAVLAAYNQLKANETGGERPLIFHEVSRADLVGAYKGHTAPKVKAAIKKANGGVLFIDEAYSLVKHSRDTFGREAVDTLIAEIENHRKHVVVIFAGYSRNMDEFFESNPGFKSRVPFTLDFEDYSCTQLMGIADIQLRSKGMALQGDIKDSAGGLTAREWLEHAVQMSTGCCDPAGADAAESCPLQNRFQDNSNGRSVRNILEKTYRHAAKRTMGEIGRLEGWADRLLGYPQLQPGEQGGKQLALDLACATAEQRALDPRCLFVTVHPDDLKAVAGGLFVAEAKQACGGEFVHESSPLRAADELLATAGAGSWDHLSIRLRAARGKPSDLSVLQQLKHVPLLTELRRTSPAVLDSKKAACKDLEKFATTETSLLELPGTESHSLAELDALEAPTSLAEVQDAKTDHLCHLCQSMLTEMVRGAVPGTNMYGPRPAIQFTSLQGGRRIADSNVVAPFRQHCEGQYKGSCRSLLHRIVYEFDPAAIAENSTGSLEGDIVQACDRFLPEPLTAKNIKIKNDISRDSGEYKINVKNVPVTKYRDAMKGRDGAPVRLAKGHVVVVKKVHLARGARTGGDVEIEKLEVECHSVGGSGRSCYIPWFMAGKPTLAKTQDRFLGHCTRLPESALLLPNLNKKYEKRDMLGDHLIRQDDRARKEAEKAAADAAQAAEDALELAPLKRPTSPAIDALMAELNGMIGLTRVKKAIAELKDLVEFDFWRKTWFGRDLTLLGQSFHMAFLGNPGTGKTVVARIVGELLIEMGVLEVRQSEAKREKQDSVLREAARQDLVGEHVGKTAIKTKDLVKDAFGRVLFIDEAYSVSNGEGDSFGQEAVDTLIKEMEDNRDKVIVILAGYKDEMQHFLDVNPGFKSRVPNLFEFDDYTCDELDEIAQLFLKKQQLAASEDERDWLGASARVATACAHDPDVAKQAGLRNDNGRAVRNIVDAGIRMMSKRVVPVVQENKPLQAQLKRIAAHIRQTRMRENIVTGKYLQRNVEKLPRPCDPTGPDGPKFAAENREACLVFETVVDADFNQAFAEFASKQVHKLCGKDAEMTTTERNALARRAAGAAGMPVDEVAELFLTDCAAAKKAFGALPEPREAGDEEAAFRAAMLADAPEGTCQPKRHGQDCKAANAELRRVDPRLVSKGKSAKVRACGEECPYQPGVRDIFEELDSMIGLASIKTGMLDLYATVQFGNWRKGLGLPGLGGSSYHMQFLGNPGTGKTVVARIVGHLMMAMGALDAKPDALKGQHGFTPVSRAELVAGSVGGTAGKVVQAFQQAKGGVLFVDEAYSLVQGDKDDFGREAVDTLIKLMEDRRDEVIVILAGYEKDMERLFQANPGFPSRVPFTFTFEDYSCEQLVEIGGFFTKKSGVSFARDAERPFESVVHFATACCDEGDVDCQQPKDAGNGRTVRNIVEALERRLARRWDRDVGQQGSLAATVGKRGIQESMLRTRQRAEEGRDFKRLGRADVQDVAAKLVEERLERACGRFGLLETLTNGVKEGRARKVTKDLVNDDLGELRILARDADRLEAVIKGGDGDDLGRMAAVDSACNGQRTAIQLAIDNELGFQCMHPEGKFKAPLVDGLQSPGIIASLQAPPDDGSATRPLNGAVKLVDTKHELDFIVELAQALRGDQPTQLKNTRTCEQAIEEATECTVELPVAAIYGNTLDNLC